MYTRLKYKVHLLLDPTDGGTSLDRVINVFIVTLIILNTLAVIIETVQGIYQPYKHIFDAVELFSITIFTTEYILRLWSCTSMKKYSHPVKGRLRYIFSWGAMIDLLAILPFYLPLLIKYDLRFIRTLRLLRFFRFFKLSRYFNASKVITNVFVAKKDELLISMVITLSLTVIASTIMYYTEHEAQPERFSSIPETMLWSVATLTTGGYGQYPVTPLGKFLTACISILGIGMFALPAGILASGFADEVKTLKTGHKHCPHCGKEL